MIGAQVTMEEVHSALFSMESYKSPGPDGYSTCCFLKAKWDVLGSSIFQFVNQVFHNPKTIDEANQTLLTLIPKVVDLARASNFQPIALCNVIYKVVMKVLAIHIKNVLPNVISNNQSSFIAGRNSIDNSIVLQETVHSMQFKTGRKHFMVVKLDLTKAYDKWSGISSWSPWKFCSFLNTLWI